MFENFKKALGIGAPAEETWECNPLAVIDDATDDLLWSGPASISYIPGEDRYEGGVGRATTPDGKETIVEFKLTQIRHRDPLGIEFPYVAMMPWGESGVSIAAVDADGCDITLHTGSHAAGYLSRRALSADQAEYPIE